MTAADTLRRIAVVTVGRSDFSILKPLCQMLEADPGFEFGLWVGGAHFDPAAGPTIRDIEASGLPVWARIEEPVQPHTPHGTAQAMAAQLAGFAAVAEEARAAGRAPDLVVILGDRYEAVSAGLALVPFNIPIGHISGGSVTEGAIDDVFRHALTKFSALHFCDVPEFARRIQRMGEAPERIFCTGALGLDGIHRAQIAPFDEFAAHFGFKGLRPGFAIATLHPETRAPGGNADMARAMIAALRDHGLQVVYTYPNADPGAGEIIAELTAASEEFTDHHLVRNFGSRWFYTAMSHAGLVVGNSSSGIIEAASFGLPVVDIAGRQRGRFHGLNVLHCASDQQAIAGCIAEARSERMAELLSGFVNPYGDGHGADRVMQVLRRADWRMIAADKPFAEPDADFTGSMVELT